MAFGPYGLGWMQQSEAMKTIGEMGMLYIMFLSGIEIDLSDFNRNRNRIGIFGVYTFFFPFVIGLLATHWLLGYSWITSVLMGSMLGSHTLMTYPIVSRYNIQKNSSVNIVIGATMLAVSFSLIILAGINGWISGTTSLRFWLLFGLKIVAFCVVVLLIFPRLTQWLFKRYIDPVTEFLLVLTMMFLSAWMAELVGLVGILGAFLAGVALNRQIPNLSPLMSKINFVGNTLFVPVFLLGVGMMVRFSAFYSSWTVIIIAVVMVCSKVIGKGIAALIAKKQFGFTARECELVFALTQAAAAGTLAVISVGCKIGLFDDAILNASVIMILTMCTISSFLTEHAAKLIALNETATDGMKVSVEQDWLLIGQREDQLSRLSELCDFSQEELLVLSTVQKGRERVEKDKRATLIYHEHQPLNTINQLRVAIPRYAEKESGFYACFELIRQLSGQAGAHVTFYAGSETRQVLEQLCRRNKKRLSASFVDMDDWEDCLQVAKDMNKDEMFVCLTARHSTISYNTLFEQLPNMLERFFSAYNYMLLFPRQAVDGANMDIYLTDIPQSSESFSVISAVKGWLLKIWRRRQN